jgi:hypothetical protein
VLIAGGLTVVGAAIALAGDETTLGFAFRALYVVGCITAVLAVRRRALFTAVTQPPLVLFVVAVVTLYFLVSDSESGVKRLVFNVALPVAKLFPLMGWTFVAVLAIAAARVWLTHPKNAVTLTKSDRRPGSARRSTSTSTDSSPKARASRSDGAAPTPTATARPRAGQVPRAGASRSAEPRERISDRTADSTAAPRRRRAVPEAPEPRRRRASSYDDPQAPGARAYRAPDDLTNAPRLRYREPS